MKSSKITELVNGRARIQSQVSPISMAVIRTTGHMTSHSALLLWSWNRWTLHLLKEIELWPFAISTARYDRLLYIRRASILFHIFSPRSESLMCWLWGLGGSQAEMLSLFLSLSPLALQESQPLVAFDYVLTVKSQLSPRLRKTFYGDVMVLYHFAKGQRDVWIRGCVWCPIY